MDEQTVLASGTWWTLYESGKLVITSSWSDTYASDYNNYSNFAPWYSNRSSVISVEFTGTPERIRAYAFYKCSSLSSITIPDSVKSIGKGAFYGCSSIQEIVIPNGVRYIEESTFEGCSSLASVTIPRSVTSLGRYSFYSCYSLLEITLPDTIKSIYALSFSKSSSYTITIYFSGTKKQFDKIWVYYTSSGSTVSATTLEYGFNGNRAIVYVRGLSGITIESPPTKTAYYTGETLVGNGLSVTAEYNTGFPDSYSQQVFDYSLLPSTPLKSSDSVMTVSYTDSESGSVATASVPISITHGVTEGDFTVEAFGAYKGVPLTASFTLTMNSS